MLVGHLQAAINSLGKLSRSPVISIMTALIIGIALALPSTLFVALKNAELLGGNFQQTMQITLYLKKASSPGQINSFKQTLQKNSAIKSLELISPVEGLQELQKHVGFDGTLEKLQENPLPWVMIVIPKTSDNKAIEQLGKQLKQFPLVDDVQLDMLWVKRLTNLIMLAHRLAYLLAAFLGIAVLLIVNNMIRSATEHHRKEIEVIKLIGGTNAFIRRPFLYAGMTYGLLGGIIAWLLVDLFIWFLKGPANNLAALYHSQFELMGLNLGDTFTLLGSSVLLGLIGAWFAVTKQLRIHR